MAGAKEITSKIRSVKNTRKVTKALEMVSASKIRKSQERMAATRPYARLMKRLTGHIARANPEYTHPLMENREEIRAVGYLIITTDRGLCGGLNANQFKAIMQNMQEWEKQNVPLQAVTIGTKGQQFFRRMNVELKGHVAHLGDKPEIADVLGVTKIMLDAFRNGEIDRLYICYNDFVNSMTQKPVVDQLLPLVPDDDPEIRSHWDYLYEPDPISLLDDVLTRYVESLVFQGVLENLASEHAARMIAMKNASDNASNLIDDLQLAYNKARQASITQELSEIVSGAAAV